ncbi:alpha/beta hydrolase [Paenibacillus sp. J2TS4]|uniref:alpha/beta hydrolase n=1 Tax=Paenibacillus sp. J2TS4 TaxID=2807194 RepID=UPI001AFD9E65|nr:alpha/beta hydrolase [Paenibacillus sp. J2TS4]GIP31504.1 acetylesterase [Paenibacillus sp. J2TS4]
MKIWLYPESSPRMEGELAKAAEAAEVTEAAEAVEVTEAAEAVEVTEADGVASAAEAADDMKGTAAFGAAEAQHVLPSMTAYWAEGTGPRPAMVICPGGGYARKAGHEGEPVARWLNGLGITAFVLDYRVAPHRHPLPLSDAHRAIRLVRHLAAEWNIDPERVGILGFSAGGHLAAAAGTIEAAAAETSDDAIERHSARPDLMVLSYPVITFGEDGHEGSCRNLLGPNPSPELQERLSLQRRVDAATPPAFIWHTADDQSVPVQNSLLFANALSRFGIPFELHVFPHGRHGLGLAREDEHVNQWTKLCAAWLRKHGF